MEQMINRNVVDLEQWKRNRGLEKAANAKNIKNASANASLSNNPEQTLWIFIMIFMVSVIISIINL
ncbi:hypothetical protein EAL2_c18140 [Peptoclostridium acidaminophilum DSM 3953]|uniref:Uncharacterized protein n=1 Tax=Peptoclostridium acidaminophilum DSM 3953 TaxID=1286171 RepID=W8U8A7_PEPAC|nr:hypothetical protein [Peptoclostridium acidaminophilum]AHM57106.1 hypothetical protein EAL2_c18140 [Peptoclostridium acidaminophilum DSM 3953]